MIRYANREPIFIIFKINIRITRYSIRITSIRGNKVAGVNCDD